MLFTLSVGLATGGAGITIAHELGHKRPALDRLLSRVLLVTVAYGHFTVEHNRGHHVRVATPEDPASARYGEAFWAFLPRTLAGSLAHAWALDRREVLWSWAATLAIAAALGAAGGPLAVAFFIGQAAMAVTLLEAVNYIEHYGLARRRLADGRYERPAARHAWDAYEWLSNSFLVHLQRHADHHLNPMRSYAALQPQADSPKLPMGYPGMVPLAFVPPLWFAVMNPRVPKAEDG
jgi:alkane 1-monooxygenase